MVYIKKIKGNNRNIMVFFF